MKDIRSPIGWLMLVVAFSVFIIRAQHAGPYAIPEGGNLLAALLAILIGTWLVIPPTAGSKLARYVNWLALGASPIVLFFALYATLAEAEEVVVLYATDERGETVPLRLWVVDHQDAAWVTMPRSKANAHGLDNAQAELLREGIRSCVLVERYEERATVDTIHQLRHEKYAIQRLATSIGLFGRTVSDSTVTLKLRPC